MQARALTIRLVRLAMGASLVVPSLIFAFASWNSDRNIETLTDERLIRSLDVQQEEAQKTFLLVDLALNTTTDRIAGMPASEITEQQVRLHDFLEKLVHEIPAIQSIWIYNNAGGVLVSSWMQPPPNGDFSDRDFFRAHLKPGSATYYGQVYQSQFNGRPFFTVSRRIEQDGELVAILEVSVLPSNFFQFFSTLAYTEGLQYALIRDDGLMLARYPVAPAGAPDRLDQQTGFRRSIRQSPPGGIYTSTSPIDHVERRFAYRRFGETPLYLTAGIATSAIRTDLIWTMAAHLIYGIPVTLILFLTLFAVLRRTERLYAEIDRRSTAEDCAAPIAKARCNRTPDRRRRSRFQ